MIKLVAFIVATSLAVPAGVRAQRKPLSVQPLTHLAHEPTSARYRFDPGKGTYSTFATDGKIEYVPGPKNFLLSWNGADGTRQKLVWEPPDKVDVIVAAEVTFDSASAMYTYSYTVTSLGSSRQKLRTIYVEGAPPTSTERPDSSWYSRAIGAALAAELHVAGGWAWSQTGGPLGLAPGQTASGFRIVSHRPPTVVRCYSAGWTPNMAPREEPPDELLAAVHSVTWRFPAGFTIGPAPNDTELTAVAEVSRLMTLVDEAERQGWLGSAATTRRVRTALGSVRSAVSAGRVTEATTQIQTVLRELRGTTAVGLSSEGQALLQYRLPLLDTKLRSSRR